MRDAVVGLSPAIGLLSLVAACAGPGASVDAPSPAATDVKAPAAPPSGCGWTVAKTLMEDDKIVVERISYESSGLTVFGEVCRPKTPGKHPMMIWNHGGVSGLGTGDRDLCRAFARNAGYTTFMSEYRGEGGSGGKIEGCLGEVDDVLRLLGCTAERPYADTSRAVMMGASHGGCITARAAQRGAPVRAAVDIFGPTDWAAEHAFWKKSLDERPPAALAQALRDLINLFEWATGGTPDQVPDRYRARSPLSFAPDLAAFSGAFMMVHGTVDVLVPDSQSCALAAAAGGFESRHVRASGIVETSAPSACRDASLTWAPGPSPGPTWPGRRHLVIFEGAGHDMNSAVPAQQRMVDAALTFILAKNP